MLIRTADYSDAFCCLAGACPHTCCAKWEVVIDEETARRYQAVPGALGEKLRRALCRDEEGEFGFLLEGERCPFLDRDQLCEIHRTLGENATSITCREHPRFVEDYGPFREVTLAASCPEANRLLLASQAPLTFVERETAEPVEPGDEWLSWLVPLRAYMLALLGRRQVPLRTRLKEFLELAEAVQPHIDAGQTQTIPEWLGGWKPLRGKEPRKEGPGLFPQALYLLEGLEALAGDWKALLKQAAAAAPRSQPEALLERIAVYFAFRYLLKAVNDGELLGRAQLCVLCVLAVERLAAVCGLPEALRRFSCEVEHSEENLEALLEALCRLEAFSPERFWEELSAG